MREEYKIEITADGTLSDGDLKELLYVVKDFMENKKGMTDTIIEGFHYEDEYYDYACKFIV